MLAESCKEVIENIDDHFIQRILNNQNKDMITKELRNNTDYHHPTRMTTPSTNYHHPTRITSLDEQSDGATNLLLTRY